jgi:nucleoid-associated protein YgaU
VESLASKNLKNITVADTTDYIITGTQGTHKLRDGETIIMLARKYYGDKRLWPYIVKHNNIVSFNKVRIGMSVSIPILQPAK